MSVSLLEVINSVGYDLSDPDDATWLLAQRNQFEELVEVAQDTLERVEELETAEIEAQYNKSFPKEDKDVSSQS